jgi:hypothetical protein
MHKPEVQQALRQADKRETKKEREKEKKKIKMKNAQAQAQHDRDSARTEGQSAAATASAAPVTPATGPRRPCGEGGRVTQITGSG